MNIYHGTSQGEYTNCYIMYVTFYSGNSSFGFWDLCDQKFYRR